MRSNDMAALVEWSKRVDRKLDALLERTAPSGADTTQVHPVVPATDEIVFGPDMRELGLYPLPEDEREYPQLSTCKGCGRQIMKVSYAMAWEYCGA